MPIAKNVKKSRTVKIPYPKLVNLYGCRLGPKVFVGPFVEIQNGVTVGAGTRISSHSFICTGVSLGKSVFVAHGVTFINDAFKSRAGGKWELSKTQVDDRVRIGSNATILPVRIGVGAVIGAGAVVTKNVRAGAVVVGNPAREIGKHKENNIIRETQNKKSKKR
jgi:UDP-2-acetamido-3-amino-2,3-dideoxy-glucuronate N-acetyltransferase